MNMTLRCVGYEAHVREQNIRSCCLIWRQAKCRIADRRPIRVNEFAAAGQCCRCPQVGDVLCVKDALGNSVEHGGLEDGRKRQ